MSVAKLNKTKAVLFASIISLPTFGNILCACVDRPIWETMVARLLVPHARNNNRSVSLKYSDPVVFDLAKLLLLSFCTLLVVKSTLRVITAYTRKTKI